MSTSTNKERLARMAEQEASAMVSVGGLAVTLAALERQERSLELMALGKLIDLRRREKGLTVEELIRKSHVTQSALADLERGLRMPYSRDVICLLARVLELPAEKLLAVAGLNGEADLELGSAVLKIASQARPPEQLSPSEQDALEQLLEVLAVA